MLIVLVPNRKRLSVFVVGVLAEAEGWVGDAGSRGVHQPRSTAAVVCVCVYCASMPAGPHHRRSIGHPHRHMSSMRVLRWTLSSHAIGIDHLNLHVQACADTRSRHMSPDSSKMSSWLKDKSNLGLLAEYVLMEKPLV